MASKKRTQLINTANSLFYKDGFHATGIDRILDEANIAKMTLYNHFASKDDLISKALASKSEKVLAWLAENLDNHAVSERDKLFTIFDIYENWFKSEDFFGCMFAKAAAEFPNPNHPVHKEASKHLAKLFEMLLSIATKAKVNNPNTVAEQIVLLLEGASSVAFSTGATISARRAKRTVMQLVR